MLERLQKFISRRHYEFTISWSFIGQGFAILSFETFAMLFCQKFDIYGIPAMAIYLGIPVVGCIICVLLGMWMIRSGYQHQYAKYASDTNGDWVEMKDNIKEIKQILTRK